MFRSYLGPPDGFIAPAVRGLEAKGSEEADEHEVYSAFPYNHVKGLLIV